MTVRDKELSYFVVLATLVLVFAAVNSLSIDWPGMSFLAITVQSLVFSCFIGRTTVSLVKVYYAFSLMFLSLIPWLHYTNARIIWGVAGFNAVDYIVVNVCIFLSNIFAAAVYLHYSGRKYCPSVANSPKRRTESFRVSVALISVSSAAFLLLLQINNFSWKFLFFRGLFYDVQEQFVESLAASLLITNVSRLTAFFCFAYAFAEIKNRPVVKLILFLLFLFCVFPTGVPRYMVGFVYIPVLLMFFEKFRDARVFLISLVSALCFVFPFLDQFRTFGSRESISLLPDKEFFFAAHFDAYQNFARAIQVDFTTYGNQLLGVLFFYIPRSFWPGKPVGSGYELARMESYEFYNISMPFIGEGYVNFGFVGVFIFVGVLSYAMAKLDRRFQVEKVGRRLLRFPDVLYFYMIGALFFILRGDLLSSTAYFSAGLFSAWFVNRICNLLKKQVI